MESRLKCSGYANPKTIVFVLVCVQGVGGG